MFFSLKSEFGYIIIWIFLSLSRWSRPSQVNGALEFYSIFLSHDGAEPVLAYNSSELFEDHTLRNLTPGTAYTITLAVSPLTLASYFICIVTFSHTLMCYVHVRPAQEVGVP